MSGTGYGVCRIPQVTNSHCSNPASSGIPQEIIIDRRLGSKNLVTFARTLQIGVRHHPVGPPWQAAGLERAFNTIRNIIGRRASLTGNTGGGDVGPASGITMDS
ncbi:hypothetical protein GMLC_10470 [Geomonas limicola]|uniref:Uncharacterized protein n=1 Tax=Geomonas limicola TaxID=2740186 RepID=A0A6V8N4H8_9BACT|nr:hypothetical protein GMLC_10470 [Geomonas limicola]